MADTEFERRLNQHERDLREVYEELTGITRRITSLDGTMLATKTRLDQMEWDMRGIRGSVDVVQGDVGALRADVAVMREQIQNIADHLMPPED